MTLGVYPFVRCACGTVADPVAGQCEACFTRNYRMNHEPPVISPDHPSVKALVDASLVVFARLFRSERNKHEQVTPGAFSTTILSGELSCLQAALTEFTGGPESFLRVALAEIAAQEHGNRVQDAEEHNE